MSGETEDAVSAFTVDSLHFHLQKLMDERDRRYDERQAQQRREVDTALTAINERLANLNELRAVVSDRDKAFITRVEYDTAHDALAAIVASLSSRLDRAEGASAGVRLSTGVLVSVVTVAVLVIGVIVAVANFAAR